ncbi:hypothetical protein PN419_17855 [Halorubrum ezzemoulense]|uniref:hypothetical protein n=1 Tax=Halorubrum ezzemoulense TaxID=337243 RepID=UPI00232FCF47|nr:hypothetical protein [Halorubrum ezzemoulense]MDB9250839.1 hypothetical protein [Halorubrum ezzemoulense]MDB9261010.1 hypothetical protein [Halorubrum ezzemoulense]MDB9264397.1 hypothetical protein [Halorubrum ezzemoulense]MDB9267887.1 hypothetical protein [Halorubrum ezzemoulense]MDB9271371.1 hypothetical protein [Halorubrum ezzemoulense]
MTAPAFEFTTHITRDRLVTHHDGSLTVRLHASTEPTVTLSVEGPDETTDAVLTPTAAEALGTALVETAMRASALEATDE